MHARRIHLHPMKVNKLLKLRKEAELDGEYRMGRRIHAVLLNHDGLSSGEISTVLKAPRSRVSDWLRNYEDFGEESLLEGHRSGRPSALTEIHRRILSDIIDSGPVAYGYLSGVWTSPMVGAVIEEQFGVAYHKSHVCRLLHALGFSVQRPRFRLARADDEARNRWRRYRYPRLKKGRKR